MEHADKWMVAVEGAPSKGAGFYPAIRMWNPEEGGLPSGAFWDGDWAESLWYIALFIDERYETEDEAKARAYQFDPNL